MPVAATPRDHTAHAFVLWLRLSYGVLKQNLPLLVSLNESVKQLCDQSPNSPISLCLLCLYQDVRAAQGSADRAI